MKQITKIWKNLQMETWWKISLLLSVFGFLKEVRPSEPYIYDYLTGKWKNFTSEQVEQEVYPVGTYASMILLLIVFLITDILRYKPLIILLGLSGLVTWGMLIWAETLFLMQVLEVFYGIFMATEVAYYSYIYAKVDKEYFQKVSAHTRGATLFGRALSGILSQSLTSTNVMDFKDLNYITFSTLIVATLWSISLPRVKTSIYFHTDATKDLNFKLKSQHAFKIMKEHFKTAYSNFYVIKWSIWWSLSLCGYTQIETYMQPLYSKIQGDDEVAYNGAVEAILTFFGFIGALIAGYLKINWKINGELILGIISIIQGVFIIIASQTNEIFICYTLYIIYGILFHFMVTIAASQVAENIQEDSYGLIFGINQFISLIFNSILTFAVATKNVGFHLPAREQYIVYGTYHLIIALLFVIMGIQTIIINRKNKQKNYLTDKEITVVDENN